MDGFAATDFGFAREVLQRGIAALYVIAFVSTINQFRPLLGERGLLPAPDLLRWAASCPRAGRMLHPTVFRWWRYSDRRLLAVCVIGITIAASLVLGLPQLGGAWVPMVCFLTMWGLYLSIVSIGQTFYAFGWEMLLLEAGFLAAFLGSDRHPPTTVAIVLMWWLVFRLEFGAGMIKIRGGKEWRDLTALTFHHETQPMPGPFSRQAHLLPRWFHRAEVLGNHLAQLVVPWLLFMPLLGLWIDATWPAIVGAVAAGIVILTQLWLVLTGNFAWLNVATIILAFSGIGLPGVGAPRRDAASDPPWLIDDIALYWLVGTTLVGVGYALLSVPAIRNIGARRQLMNASFNRWQLANAYGAFGTVTRERIEYIVEGTRDPDPTSANWCEYGFTGKPGDLRRIPGQFAPYHLRLDWLMWFLPLEHPLEDWFAVFLRRLLEADAATLRLLAKDPFEGARPRWVRVVSYRYRFTTREEFRRGRERWARDRRREVVSPLSLPEDNG